MKICYFNSGYLPDRGGVATLAAGLAEHMVAHPSVDAVRVVAFKNTNPRTEKRGKLEIFSYATGNILKMLWLVWWHIMKARDFDVFHATNIFPVGFFVLLFGRRLKKKVFLTIHGTDTLTKKGSFFVHWAKRYTLRNVDRVIANSNATAELSAKHNGVPRENYLPIYVGVDDFFFTAKPQDLRVRYGLSSQDLLVLTVAQLIPRKGVDDLIRAIAKIGDSTVKLVIIGKGPEKENLQRLSEELQIRERVIFVGTVAHSEMADYYKTADVFALTSRYLQPEGDIEGFGIVFMEAQLFRMPVIGTRSGGIPETMLDGKTGFLVNENNPAAIAEKIKYLRDNREMRFTMGQAGERFVKEERTWQKSVERHLTIYQI